jgi:uncharacterized membrane protein (DUF485 family)
MESKCQNVDVVFTESPRKKTSWEDRSALFWRNPSFLIGGILWKCILGVIGLIAIQRFTSIDHAVALSFAEDHDLPVVPVDSNAVRQGAKVGIGLTLVSWVLFLLAVSGGAATLAVATSGFPRAGLTIGLASFVLVFIWVPVYARTTVSERDKVMSKNIRDAMKTREDVSKGVLVVGNGHVPGVKENMDRAGVEVEECHQSRFARVNR